MKETRESSSAKDAGRRSQVADKKTEAKDKKPAASDKKAAADAKAAPAQPAAAVAAQAVVDPAVPAVPVVPVPAAAAAAAAAGQAVSVAQGAQAKADPQLPAQVPGPVVVAAGATATAASAAGQVATADPAGQVPGQVAQQAKDAAPQVPQGAKPVVPVVDPKVAAKPEPAKTTDAKTDVKQPVTNTNSNQSPAADAPAKPKAAAPTQATTAPTPDTQPPTSAAQPAAQQPATGQTQPTADTPPTAPGPQPTAPVVQPQAAPQQPVAQAAPVAQPALPQDGAARLHQAVETVHAVIKMSQSSGITQARVQLHPEELGQVDIHLRQTSDGLVARVVADAAQAAHVLKHGGEELRRSLEAQGLNLVRLDVSTAGGEQRRSGFGPGDGQSSRQGGQNAPQGDNSDLTPETTTAETTVRLPNGVLVDVLA